MKLTMLANCFDAFIKVAMKLIAVLLFPYYSCVQDLEHLLLSEGGWDPLQFLCIFPKLQPDITGAKEET